MTGIFKYVLPVFVFPTLAALLVVAIPEGFMAGVLALIFTIFILFVFKEFIVPLKRVVAMEDGLRVSGLRTSFDVSYSEIWAVTRVAKRLDIIEVVFRTDTPFGRAVKFMAGARFFWWPEHPVVAFLRERAGLAAE